MLRESNTIIWGDALSILDTFPSESFDCCLTDPPYGDAKVKMEGNTNINVFVTSLSKIFRILRDNVWFVTFCSSLFVPEIIEEARRVGFLYRWLGFIYYPTMYKQKPQPLGYNRYDLFIIFSKGSAKKKGYIKDTIHYVLDNSSKEERKHPAQKPEKAFEKLIKATTNEGDLLIDPFVGVGTSCIVAKRMNRNFIGIDISNEYCELARKKLGN